MLMLIQVLEVQVLMLEMLMKRHAPGKNTTGPDVCVYAPTDWTSHSACTSCKPLPYFTPTGISLLVQQCLLCPHPCFHVCRRT